MTELTNMSNRDKEIMKQVAATKFEGAIIQNTIKYVVEALNGENKNCPPELAKSHLIESVNKSLKLQWAKLDEIQVLICDEVVF